MKREKYNLTIPSVDIERFEAWLKQRTDEGKITGKEGVTVSSTWPVKFKYMVDRVIDAERKIGKAEEEKIFHANAARDASRIKSEYDAKLQQLIEHTAKLQDTEKNRELPPGI